MKPIHSGPTTERIVRSALIATLVTIYSVWSLWDGFVAYPRRNVEAAIRGTIGGKLVDPPPAPNADLTRGRAESLAVAGGRSALHDRIGPPHLSIDEVDYYFGYGGYLRVETRGGHVVHTAWSGGPKYSAADLTAQRWIGLGLAPVALALLIRLWLVLTTRVSLTDAGLTVRGRPPIPLDAMSAVRPIAARSSRRYAIHFETTGRSESVYLDDYEVAAAAAIVSAICTARDWVDPTRSTASTDATPPSA